MHKYLIFLLLFLTPLHVCADTNWYRISANTMLAADYFQTRHIIESDRYLESNPILGYEPTQKDVDRYFMACFFLTNGIGQLLPKKYSDLFYLGIALGEAKSVRHNYMMGVRFKF